MRCPVCVSENQKSVVRITGTKSPEVPKDHFYDEQGQEHSHNPNIIRTTFRCSNGHRFEEASSWECVVCGYKACEAEVFITPGEAYVPEVAP